MNPARGRIWTPEAPFVIARRTPEALLAMPDVGISGRFTIELVHARTGGVARRHEFNNLVVNAGLDVLGTGSLDSAIAYCAVGTGSTPPTENDVGLEAELTRTNNAGGFSDSSGSAPSYAYYWRRRTRVFTQAQANGNLTEIGFFKNATGAPMWCRQLIRDSAGNPTTITKTSEYELRVVYEWRVYPPAGDVPGTVTVNGATVATTTRAIRLNEMGWTDSPANLGVYDTYQSYVTVRETTQPGNLGGNSAWALGTLDAGYAPGSLYRDSTVVLGASAANWTGGVGSFEGFAHVYWQYGANVYYRFHTALATPIMKTATQKLTLVQRMSWARHHIG
jgi:hypothetical protein